MFWDDGSLEQVFSYPWLGQSWSWEQYSGKYCWWKPLRELMWELCIWLVEKCTI